MKLTPLVITIYDLRNPKISFEMQQKFHKKVNEQ